MLLKDYATGKKSFTMTGLLVTFVLLLICMIVVLFKGLNNADAIGWFSIPFGFFAGIYLNKRIRISSTGIDIRGDNESADT